MTEFRSNQNGRLISVSADSPYIWIQTGSKVAFVRDSYEDIWGVFRDEFLSLPDTDNDDDRLDGMIVTGTPGCGKSCFLDFALHQLRTLHRSVLYVYAKSGQAHVFSDDGRVTTYPISDAISGGHTETVDFVLLDPPEGGDPNFWGLKNLKKKPFILAVSPDTNNCQSLRKDASFLQLYMGPLSLEEAGKMRVSCYSGRVSDRLLEKRFKEFGGIPRYLFERLRGGEEDLLLQPIRTMQQAALRDVVLEPRRADDGEISSAFKSLWTLYHLLPLLSNDGTTNYYKHIVVPCCDDAHNRIRDALMEKDVKDLWTIYSNTREELGALRGIRYEAYAHKKIMTEGLEASAVGLLQSGLSTAAPKNVSIPAGLTRITLPSNNVGQALLDAVAQGRTNVSGTYLLPHFSNFPVVDSIFVPHGEDSPSVLLQMKAGKSRPLATDKATSIIGATGSAALIFVTPDLTTMTKKLAGADNLQQYRVVLNESS